MEKQRLLDLASEDDEAASIIPVVIHTCNNLLENIWLKNYETLKNFDENYSEVLMPQYSVSDFHVHFKMGRSTMERLIIIIGQHMNPKDHYITPLQTQVLLTVWKLSKGESFIAIADQYGLSARTAQYCFINVVTVLATLIGTYINWPSASRIKNVTHDFNHSYGVPGIVGVINSCHIPIMEPNNNGNDFYNKKCFHSVILQGVCDNKNRFTDVFIGVPGGVSNARAFRNCPLFKNATSHSLIPTENHLIGNTSFPLSIFLMVPFKNNIHLTNNDIRYNKKLYAVQSVIENTFSLLTEKFSILKYLEMSNINLIKNTIASACILHNFILMEEGDCIDYNNDYTDAEHNKSRNFVDYQHRIQSVENGRQKRNCIVQML